MSRIAGNDVSSNEPRCRASCHSYSIGSISSDRVVIASHRGMDSETYSGPVALNSGTASMQKAAFNDTDTDLSDRCPISLNRGANGTRLPRFGR